MPGNRRRLLLMVALLASMGYLGAVVFADAARARSSLLQLGWAGCTCVLALSVLNYLLRFYRWQKFLARLGRTLDPLQHLLYYLSGFAFTVSPGKAGEAFRSIHLRAHGVSYSESIAALFAERLLDLVSMCLLASLIAFDHPAFRPLIVGALLLALALLAVVRGDYLPARLDDIAKRLRRPRLSAALATLAGLVRSSRQLLRTAPVVGGLLLGLISWGAEGVGFYLICQSLQLPVSVTGAIGIYAIASLAGSAAVFLPAGLGGMEVVMSALLVAAGAPLRSAVIATVLCRIATLWLAVLIGVAASWIIEFRPAPHPVRSVP